MSQEISEELINKIRYYVKKYNSKRDTANKLGLSYDTGIYGKTLDLLKELMWNGYAFSSGKYGLKEYIKLKEYFPQIRRTKMYGRMIYYLDGKSKIAVNAILEVSNKKVMSYQELKQITKVFDTKLSKEEKTHYFSGEK